jgi:peptidoglycan/LPS O-acetylase OafA/YrhL
LGEDPPAYSVHLDAVRGGAATLVFLSHVRFFFLQSLTHPPPLATATAAVVAATAPAAPAEARVDPAHEAVMVFFVLSGFLVGGSAIRLMQAARWSWKRYLIHRTVRLWMVLLPVLLIGLLLDTAGTRHFAGQGTVYSAGPGNTGWDPDVTARLQPHVFAGNVFFLQEIVVPTLGTNKPLWSLANEFWYYLAFPCLALAAAGQGSWAGRVFAAAAMVAILLFAGSAISLYFLIWLMGAGAAMLPLRIPPRLRRAATVSALVLFLAVNVMVRALAERPFLVDFLVGSSFFLLLYGILHFTEASRSGIYRTCARFMSKISYSLYLIHAPLLCLLSAVLVGKYRLLPLNGHTAVVLAEVIAVVGASACAVHFLFEARTNRVRNFLEARL